MIKRMGTLEELIGDLSRTTSTFNVEKPKPKTKPKEGK